MDRLRKPVIFVGSPRSGTTLIYEVFARHPDLGWLSNYSTAFPSIPAVNVVRRLFDNHFFRLAGQKQQYAPLRFGNRFLPRPEEAYNVWNRYTRQDFDRNYLLNETCSDDSRNRTRNVLQQTLKWQGRTRFASKLTGPLRIAYLQSIFEDALFVHIIRDGRSVVRSLMDMNFWRKGGMDEPYWNPGFSDEYVSYWETTGHDPAVLAALQWCSIIRSGRDESKKLAATQYLELRYEDYVDDPHGQLQALYEFAELDDCAEAHEYIRSLPHLTATNDRYSKYFDADTRALIQEAMGSMLSELGYEISVPNSSVDGR